MKEVTKISELSNKTSHGCVTAGWLKTTKAWLGASFDVTVRSRAEPTKCVFWCGHIEREIFTMGWEAIPAAGTIVVLITAIPFLMKGSYWLTGPGLV